MTIEEIIANEKEYIEYLMIAVPRKSCKTSQISSLFEQHTSIIDMLNELNWWREQALIDRGDVIGEFATCLVECPPNITCRNCLYKRIKELPKAKPPISQNLVENSQEIVKDCNGCFGASFGDCETCKHYDEPCSKTCGDGVDYYEPYIPKENEQ